MTVALCLILAALILAACGPSRSRKAIGGLIGKDKKGNTTLTIWPATSKKKRRKR